MDLHYPFEYLQHNLWLNERPGLLQPYFRRVNPSLPKWGLRSPPGLPKLQSLIVGVKTPCVKEFFISLKRYRSVDVKNGLA